VPRFRNSHHPEMGSRRVSESKDTGNQLIPSVVLVSTFAPELISAICELRNHDAGAAAPYCAREEDATCGQLAFDQPMRA
jgi:hypothetical protein